MDGRLLTFILCSSNAGRRSSLEDSPSVLDKLADRNVHADCRFEEMSTKVLSVIELIQSSIVQC